MCSSVLLSILTYRWHPTHFFHQLTPPVAVLGTSNYINSNYNYPPNIFISFGEIFLMNGLALGWFHNYESIQVYEADDSDAKFIPCWFHNHQFYFIWNVVQPENQKCLAKKWFCQPAEHWLSTGCLAVCGCSSVTVSVTEQTNIVCQSTGELFTGGSHSYILLH